jgi:ketosteroid isomerase-like protein
MHKLLGLVLLLLAIPAIAGSQDTRADESKIIAMENAWNQAQLQHDAKALELMVADGFVDTEADGSVNNKAQFLASIKDPSFEPASMVNEDVRVHIYRDVAVVTGGYRTKGTIKGKPYEHRGRFTDTWINLGGRWQCVASHSSWIAK